MEKQMVRRKRPKVESFGAAELTPDAFDRVFPSPPIWGAKSIGQEAGVSAETVRRSWPRDPACPVRRIGGRFVVYPEDLRAWLRARG